MKDIKHIQEEIKSLSPLLDQLRANDAMKNMEQSFVDSESDIISAIHSNTKSNYKSMEILSVKFPLQQYFPIPENYFESSEDAIINKINSGNQTIKYFLKRKIFTYAVAACVVSLLGLSIFSYYSHSGQNDTNLSETEITKEFESLPEADILEYLQDSGTDVEAALVASLTEEDNLPSEDDILLNEDIFTNLKIQSLYQSENQKSSL